jgi:hypothetical protein
MNSATFDTPCPARMFVKTNGRSPRMRLASRSITPRSAPTSGARSILVDHQEVGAGDAGAALTRDLVAGGNVDHVDRPGARDRDQLARQLQPAC